MIMIKANKLANEGSLDGLNICDLKMIFDYEAGDDIPASLSFSIEESPNIIGEIESIKQNFAGKLTFGNVSVEDGDYRLAVKKDFTLDLLEALSSEIDIVDDCEYFTNISSTDRSFAHALSSIATDGSKWVIGDIDLVINDSVLQLRVETKNVNDMPSLAQGAKEYLDEHYDIYVDKCEYKGADLSLYISPRAVLMSSLAKIHKGVDFINRTSFIK